MLNLIRTADPSAKHAVAFCRSINTTAVPVLLHIAPVPEAEPLDCFNNVRRRVAQDGGRIVHGWVIWEWPGVYVEAEHHAVYEPAPGHHWRDLTPAQVPDISTRLFLEDSTAEYDFENEGVRRDNIRKALSGDPLIHAFFESARAVSVIWNSVPGVGEVAVSRETAARLQSAERRSAELVYQLAMKYTPRNARCFCGSDEKFKRCHGRDSA